jgi:hypothetical protein
MMEPDLRQFRQAEGGWREMNMAQAGDMVETPGYENGLRLVQKHLYRLGHVLGASTVGFDIQDAVVWER